jgi:hypothetical protein
MRAAGGVDQLHIDPDLLAETTDATFEQAVHAEVAADLLHIDRFVLAGKAVVREMTKLPRSGRGRWSDRS